MTATDSQIESADKRSASKRIGLLGPLFGSALWRGLKFLALLMIAIGRIFWNLLRPFIRVISGAGWLVLILGFCAVVASFWLGWIELFFLGATLLGAIIVAIAFIFGRSTYAVEIELNPRRVVVGEKAIGSIIVSNSGEKNLLATRMELPVGSGSLEFTVPQLAPGDEHDELFNVPTNRRAVIVAGPAVSVRGDQLGLLRREVKWSEPIDLFVHPITVRLNPSAAGLVRDLEGQVSKKITSNDISFHALRQYVPGDDRRNVHWRTSARTGQLMVRQFEETRRSQLTIIHSTDSKYYASSEEFELAVSATASIGIQVILDGTRMSIVTEMGAMRTHSITAMLDDCCRIDLEKSRYPSARAFARDKTKRLPAASVAFIVSGSLMTTTEFRSIETLFPVDTTVIGVRVVEGNSPKLSAISGMKLVDFGVLTDLPRLLGRLGK